MAVTKIAPSTPIREFPDIYNRNVKELVDEIDRLRGLLAEKDKEINNIVASMNAALSSIRSEYQTKLDQKFDQKLDQKLADFKRNYVKVSELESLLKNKYAKISELESLLEDKFVKKEDNQ